MLDACMHPDLVVELTLQPLRRYAVDAAVLFSDIVLPLRAVGVNIDIQPGLGPVVAEPVRTVRDLARLGDLESADLGHIQTAVRALVGELRGTPLVAFAGGPFTLASYLVDGGPTRTHQAAKALMYGDESLWRALLDRLSAIATASLRVQVEAGARAVQLFDSWVGAVSPADYERLVLPYTRRIFAELDDLDVPRIHFGVGTGELLGSMSDAHVEVVGVDWRVPLDEAVRRVAPGTALQGNLDPAALFAPWPAVAERARDVIMRGRTAEGHVFNLGHGVLPTTDPDVLSRLADFVHEESARAAESGT